MNDLRRLVVSGTAWNVIAGLGRYAFDLVVNIVLARVLLPSDFGVVAMATVVSAFVAIFGTFGLGSALVQRSQIDARHVSAVFWLSLLIGVGIGAVTAAAGPLAAWFYGEPRLTTILLVLALQFPIAGLLTVPQSLLQRDLRWKTLARVELGATALSGAIAVTLAILGAGIWSIVVRSMITHATTAVMLMAIAPVKPRLRIDGDAARQLMKFSLSFYGDQLLKFASRNLDTVLVGKFLGSGPLGVYSRAYALMIVPLGALVTPLFRVLFSAFSAIQDDHARIGSLHLRYVGALALVMLPASTGLSVAAEPAVLTVLGDRWLELVGVLRVLAPAASWHGIMGLYSAIYMAKGRTDLQLKYTLIGRALMIVGTIVGLNWGILGVAWGVSIGTMMDATVNIVVAGRLVDLSLRRLLSHLKWVLVANFVMAGGVFAVARLDAVRELPPWLQLVVLSGAGIVIYTGLVLVLRPAPYNDILALARSYRTDGTAGARR